MIQKLAREHSGTFERNLLLYFVLYVIPDLIQRIDHC
jgi:hypothetical protein